MDVVKYIVNLPWSIIALLLALISLPRKLYATHHAIIVHITSFWWLPTQGVRATTLGNIVLLGKIEKNDLAHELIHIEQGMRLPFIFPIVAFIERLYHGPHDSKYEQEAYGKAGNTYKK